MSQRTPSMEYMTAAQLEEEKRNLINREIERFRGAYEQREQQEKQDAERTNDIDVAPSDQRNSSDRRTSVDRRADSARRDLDNHRTSRDRDRERGYFDRRDRRGSREPDLYDGSISNHSTSRSGRSSHRPTSRDRTYFPPSSSRDRRDIRDSREPRDIHRTDHHQHRGDSSYDIEEEQERRRIERKEREKEMSYQHRLRDWQRRERYKKEEHEAQLARDREKRLLIEQESRRLKIFLEDYKDDRDDVRFYMGSALAKRLTERRKEIEKDVYETQRERAELEKLSAKCAADETNDVQINSEKGNRNTNSTGSLDARLVAQQQTVNHVDSNAMASTSTSTDPQAGITPTASTSATTVSSTSSTSNSKPLSASDKRSKMKKQIEELINSIPTTRDDLFNYKFDWSYLDDALMNHRIRPWVTKKVTEYIGEADETFIEFICARLQAHNEGPSILREVAAVLDDEAEEFVVKMWRLLIYEIEAKKLGISKSGNTSNASSDQQQQQTNR